MTVVVGLVFTVAALLLFPRLILWVYGLLIWCVVLAMLLILAVPLIVAVAGIAGFAIA